MHCDALGYAASFLAIEPERINIQMISPSEIKIAVILDKKKIEEAANVAHNAVNQ